MLVGFISAPAQSRLAPGCVRNEMMARPLMAAECAILGRLSEKPLHPQAMQIDAREVCGEMPPPHDRHLGPRCADRCRVVVWVGEGVDCARRMGPRWWGCDSHAVIITQTSPYVGLGQYHGRSHAASNASPSRLTRARRKVADGNCHRGSISVGRPLNDEHAGHLCARFGPAGRGL
jgi:hypothetical protein